jgi:hypothetical protein
VIARLRLAVPLLLTQLLEEPLSGRGIRERLGRLNDAALVARANVRLEGRRGRPPALYAVAPRGREYLRRRRQGIAPDQEVPRYLDKDRRLRPPGRGSDVPHELEIQVALVALRQYGTGTRPHWHTTRMPGGRWDVGMVHNDQRDRTLRLADLLPAPGYSIRGEQLDVLGTLEPDLSVQLQGDVDGQRAVIDLLLEIDRTGRGAYNAAKFAAYDQFLGGWCLRTRRFGRERRSRPVVVFVASRADRIPPLLHAADRAMTLGFGAPAATNPRRSNTRAGPTPHSPAWSGCSPTSRWRCGYPRCRQRFVVERPRCGPSVWRCCPSSGGPRADARPALRYPGRGSERRDLLYARARV